MLPLFPSLALFPKVPPKKNQRTFLIPAVNIKTFFYRWWQYGRKKYRTSFTMNLQNIFNLSGLVINMAGAYLMYRNAPPVNSKTFLYQDKELQELAKRDKRKNKMSRNGMLLLFVGFLLQLVAFFL